MKLPPEEEKERLKLYNQGLNDGQIARKLYVSRDAIKSWRRSRKLPANAEQGEKPGISDKEHQRRLDYYNQGLTDREIGEEVGLSKSGVAYWRGSYDLPANRERGDNDGQGGPSISKAEHNARLNLWKDGLTDREIAERRGVSHTAIGEWRRKHGLDNSKRLTKKEKERFKGALGITELLEDYF